VGQEIKTIYNKKRPKAVVLGRFWSW